MCKLYLIIILLVLLVFLNSNKNENFTNNNEYVKIIWMYWEQGEENLKDKYNKMCIQGWRKLNPDWDVRVLNKESAEKYVPEIKNYNHLTVQMKSDLLRIKLLNKYGGVWADASTLPMKPLNRVIENIDNNTGFFCYRFIPKFNNKMIASWLLISKKPDHYLVKELDNKFSERVKYKNKKYKYFYFHTTLTDLYDKDVKIRNNLDKLTETEKLPHAPLSKKPYPKLIKENIDKMPIVFKRAKRIKREEYLRYLDSIL